MQSRLVLRKRILCVTLTVLFLFGLSVHALAQDAAAPKASPTPRYEKNFLRNIANDQKHLWLAPFHWRGGDEKWTIPLGLSLATLIATDRHTAGSLDDNPNRLRVSKDISYAGSLYSLGGITGAFYLSGKLRHDDHAKETAILATEALIDSTIISQALKGVSQRPRPRVDHSSGEFFDRGSSFPSGHAINSWTFATIVSDEYGPKHPAVRYVSYGLATVVSVSRFTGRKHFLSDVLAGSAMGYGIGHYVYKQHHDPSVGDDNASNTKTSFIPRIAPAYNRAARLYGASLAWNF